MKSPTIEEKKQVTTYFHSRECFRQVAEICDYLIDGNIDPKSNLYKWLVGSLVMAYGTPFKPNWGIGKIELASLTPQQQEVHFELMTLRDKFVVHRDQKAASKASENHNELLIEYVSPDSEIVYMHRPVYLRSEGLNEVKELATAFFEKCSYYVRKFEKKYLKKIKMRPGYYRISLEKEGLLEPATQEYLDTVKFTSN